jgi:hypothetical protein
VLLDVAILAVAAGDRLCTSFFVRSRRKLTDAVAGPGFALLSWQVRQSFLPFSTVCAL